MKSPLLSYSWIEPLESRIAPAAIGSIKLSSLNGSNGFKIESASVGGAQVNDAGDVNGDGFDDVIIEESTDFFATRRSYVVFGKAGGFESKFNVDTLNGSNGFAIEIDKPGTQIGNQFVSAAGDVNADGFGDLIIGLDIINGPAASYVIFGKASGFKPSLSLSKLNGINGFKINGETENDIPIYVSGAGDVNGDGFDDMLIGAEISDPSRDPGFLYTPATYVVYGKSGGFSASLNLATLNGSNVSKIYRAGESPYSYRRFLLSVSGAGDVNGDGYDDVVIGPGYVVFGKAGGIGSRFDLSTLDGSNGFKTFEGGTPIDVFGKAVNGAGDFNGDGFDDLIIGVPTAGPNGLRSGASYMIFGKAGNFAASLNLTALDGNNGFRLAGEAADDESGEWVSAAGDLNGDGFGDVIVGSAGADLNGEESGASYIVYGKSYFPATLNLSTLNGSNGFKLVGETRGDESGRWVSAAGDVNGDGYGDVIVSALGNRPNRDYPGVIDSPSPGYVVFGGVPITISKNGKSATFTDVDGDKVTIATNKGRFTPSMFELQVEGLGLRLNALHPDSSFAGANLSVKAGLQKLPGIAGRSGNGGVAVGEINASGIDLSNVSVQGYLGRILAGDGDTTTAGVKSISAVAFGGIYHDTPLDSVIVGALGSLKVKRTLSDANLYITGNLTPATQAAAVGLKELSCDLGSSFIGVGFDATGHAINPGASVGKVDVLNFSDSTLAITGALGSLKVKGSVTNSNIYIAGNLNPATTKAAIALKEVSIGYSVYDTFIGVGFDETGHGINPNVSVGKINVNVAWGNSSLAVGVEDKTGDGFGRNDSLINGGNNTVIASIASIVIRGPAYGGNFGEFFGIAAQQIGKASVQGKKLVLTAGPNDLSLDSENGTLHLVDFA